MAHLLLRVILIGVALCAGILYLDGISLVSDPRHTAYYFLAAVALFAVVETAVYPVLAFVLSPIRRLSFGLASLALSVALIYAISLAVPFFAVSSFPQALLLGIAFSAVRVITR